MRNGNILMHSKINLLHRRRCITYLFGHSWDTLGPIRRALVGIRVNGNLDPIWIVFLRDDRLREAVFLPVSVKIGKAHAKTFADIDKGRRC